MKFGIILILALASSAVLQSAEITDSRLDAAAAAIRDKVVAWRRDIHAHPELGNREFRTSTLVAEHLKNLGLEVKTGIAHTGVAGVLRGGRPGPVIALRADMDALPVTEETDEPFKSEVTTEYDGATVGVMHACGHDTHTAMLMGLAGILAEMRADLPGTILFIFQPAEEGSPKGERGGAELMLVDGLFEIVKPDAVFGMHVSSSINAGRVEYRSGPYFAAVDSFSLTVQGVQTHGARPWGGVDPVVVSSQIVLGLQTVVSRQTNITRQPAVLTIGSIHGGNRHNIIPDAVAMQGTLRTFDTAMRDDIVMRMQRMAENIAEAGGARAVLTMETPKYPVTINDPALTARVVPSMRRAIGVENVKEADLITGAEDFSFFANEVPGFYFMVGATPPGEDAQKAPSNHSPRFKVDETALDVGLRTMLYVTTDYLKTAAGEVR